MLRHIPLGILPGKVRQLQLAVFSRGTGLTRPLNLQFRGKTFISTILSKLLSKALYNSLLSLLWPIWPYHRYELLCTLCRWYIEAYSKWNNLLNDPIIHKGWEIYSE